MRCATSADPESGRHPAAQSEAFAEAGLTTLVYDHYGFGASDGEPRQSPAPSMQLEANRPIDHLAG
jgi:hypothetical protein